MTEIKRGDLWVVNLDPTGGHEIKKSRPALIIQNDYGNKFGPITIVAPLTSQKIDNVKPFEVLFKKIGGLDKDSKALLNQIRAIDKRRLVKKLGKLDKQEMIEVDEALKISLGLSEV